jgi:hypothetical protein
MTLPSPLGEAVATLLPGAATTLLLQGCLDRGEAGRSALQAWLGEQSDPVAELTDAQRKWMLPLVHRAFVHHGVSTGSALAVVLKSATLREELRSRSFRAILHRILASLAAAGVDPIVLRGAALCDLVYPHAALRHAHDVELLVASDAWDRARRALVATGFAETPGMADQARVELTHRSGLPLVLHRHLFRIPFYNLRPNDDAVARAEPVEIAGVMSKALSPADALVHLCGQGMHGPGWGSCRWLVDAAFLLERRGDIDWSVVVRMAASRHLALPLAVSLHYLGGSLGAPVPRQVLDRLHAIAAEDASIGPELALHAAQAAAGGLLPLLGRVRSMRGRAAVMRRRILPSMAFLRWSTQPRSPRLRVAHGQVFRLANGVGRRIARRSIIHS